MIIVKDELKNRMTKKGFTGAGLARTAKISQCYVAQLLSGKRNMSPVTAKKIYTALECDFDDVFVAK